VPPVAVPPTPGSGPNAPHPDDDDPAAFFGDGEGDAAGEEKSLMPEEGDEAAAHPEPATGEATPGQTFTEDGEKIDEVAAGDAVVEEPAAAAEETEQALAPVGQGAEDPEQAAEHAEWQAEQDRKAAEAATAVPRDAGDKPPPASTEEPKAAAAGPRGYVVIREVALTQEYVDFFAKALAEGKEPQKVYMILEDKVEARNPNPVLTGAFKKHAKRLGEPLRLAAIPLTMWKLRTLSMKPKVIDNNIAIED
jgi:hypothetical protein